MKKKGEAGHGLALAGTIIGYVATIGAIVICVAAFVLIFFTPFFRECADTATAC